MAARYGKSPSGNPLTHFVNLHQTAEERKEKYWLVISHGFRRPIAYQLRDWRLSCIEEYINYYTGRAVPL